MPGGVGVAPLPADMVGEVVDIEPAVRLRAPDRELIRTDGEERKFAVLDEVAPSALSGP